METTDLADANPQVVKALGTVWHKYADTIGGVDEAGKYRSQQRIYL